MRCSGSTSYSIWIRTGPSFGQRLDGNRQVGQLHGGRDIGFVAHRYADAAIEHVQQEHQRCRRGERDARPARRRQRAPQHAAQRQAGLHRDQVHGDGARAHPRGRGALGSGREAREHAHPRNAGAERAGQRDCRDVGRGDEQRCRRPQQDARGHHGVQCPALQLPRNRQRADDCADAEARREQTVAAGAEIELVARDHRQQRPQANSRRRRSSGCE